MNSFEQALTGGHPNSLGNTVAVVDEVLAERKKLAALFDCYNSQDEVVRLRVSSALKRICTAKPEWLAPYIDTLLNDVAKIDQASTQWTIAILFDLLKSHMTNDQKKTALKILKHNLQHHEDWIVLNTTAQVLADWATEDKALATWLKPQLRTLMKDPHKSVSRRAEKLLSRF